MGQNVDRDIRAIRAEIDRLETQLAEKYAARQDRFAYRTEGRKIVFDAAATQQHRAARSSIVTYFLNLPFRVHITAPVVYAMIIPFAVLDLSVVIYQKICFWAWRIPRARRASFVVIDRQFLEYLNGIEKLNCIFCGYANGVISFTRKVASRTEKYWCPIKHASKIHDPHALYQEFTEFGDAEAWQDESKLTGKDRF